MRLDAGYREPFTPFISSFRQGSHDGGKMLTFPSMVKVYGCTAAIDLRKSFDGLAGCVEQIIGIDPLSGHLFVFFNKRRTMVKILMWDRTGYCLWCKRLEQGRFNMEPMADKGSVMDLPELMLILEGIDLSGARRRKRFRLPVAK
jgi:transposase